MLGRCRVLFGISRNGLRPVGPHRQKQLHLLSDSFHSQIPQLTNSHKWIPSLQYSSLSLNALSRFWYSFSAELSDKDTSQTEGGPKSSKTNAGDSKIVGEKEDSSELDIEEYNTISSESDIEEYNTISSESDIEEYNIISSESDIEEYNTISSESDIEEYNTISSDSDIEEYNTTSYNSDIEVPLSFDELVAEKEEPLKVKQKIEVMQDKVLRRYAEMEDVMYRTRGEARNSEKFAIQNFAKSLLDVSDNLGRPSSVVKQSFSRIDSSKYTFGAVPLLNTLLEGVEMIEKQLTKMFARPHLEKYERLNKQFDPNKHYAIFQVPDGSKPPGTVAAVLKAGYMFHDRILLPAEVGASV